MTDYFLKKTTWTQSAGLFGNILLRCQRFSHFLTRLCVLVEGKYYYFLAGSWFPWPVSQFTNLPKSKWATSGSDRRPDTQLYDTDTDRFIYIKTGWRRITVMWRAAISKIQNKFRKNAVGWRLHLHLRRLSRQTASGY